MGKISSSPIIPPSTTLTPTPLSSPDPTIGWKTFSDPAFNFTFKYPSTITIEKRQNPKGASLGMPTEDVYVGQLLTLTSYYDRIKTLWFTQNSDLVDTTQQDLPPLDITGTTYNLAKTNWESGSPSQQVPNCSVGTAQPNYFVDIPNKVFITILFQEIKTCDPVKGQIVQEGTMGIPLDNFDQQLHDTYLILSTLQFTN